MEEKEKDVEQGTQKLSTSPSRIFPISSSYLYLLLYHLYSICFVVPSKKYSPFIQPITLTGLIDLRPLSPGSVTSVLQFTGTWRFNSQLLDFGSTDPFIKKLRAELSAIPEDKAVDSTSSAKMTFRYMTAAMYDMTKLTVASLPETMSWKGNFENMVAGKMQNIPETFQMNITNEPKQALNPETAKKVFKVECLGKNRFGDFDIIGDFDVASKSFVGVKRYLEKEGHKGLRSVAGQSLKKKLSSPPNRIPGQAASAGLKGPEGLIPSPTSPKFTRVLTRRRSSLLNMSSVAASSAATGGKKHSPDVKSAHPVAMPKKVKQGRGRPRKHPLQKTLSGEGSKSTRAKHQKATAAHLRRTSKLLKRSKDDKSDAGEGVGEGGDEGKGDNKSEISSYSSLTSKQSRLQGKGKPTVKGTKRKATDASTINTTTSDEEEDEIVTGEIFRTFSHLMTGEEVDKSVPGGGPEKPQVKKKFIKRKDRTGFGICAYPSGYVYEGQWFQGKKHGKGVVYHVDSVDKKVFQGEFVDNGVTGIGTFFAENGDRYDGEWTNGSFNGYGEYHETGEEKHAREAVSHSTSSAETTGEEKTTSAAKRVNVKQSQTYTGEWVNNIRQGLGRLFLHECNCYYDGGWDSDRFHGQGSLYIPNHVLFSGEFHHGAMEGKGVCVYYDETGKMIGKYEGGFREGLRHGRGWYKFYNEDGTIIGEYEGRFKKDEMEGNNTIEVVENTPIIINEEEWILPLKRQTELKYIHQLAGFKEDGS